MSAMVGSKYLLPTHTGRNPQSRNSQDLTPYSAVSSFNMPPYCDSTLLTPVQLQTIKSSPIMHNGRDIKLSPSAMSPYQFLADEDDFGGRYMNNPPMKHKSPSGTIHMSATDRSFPASPYVCPEPFWGAYGVSAGRSESSSNMNRSPPNIPSTGGPNTCHDSSSQNTSAYRSHTHTPILIAPNPSSLRSTTNQEGKTYRQDSLQSVSSTSGSTKLSQAPFPERVGSLKARGRKRKSPSRASREQDMVLADDKTQEEEVLLDLTLRQQLPWKEVAKRFNDIIGNGRQMKVPALQMRKKRAIERLRLWTESDEHALTLAVRELDQTQWDTIANSMLKYGCTARWPKEMCQRKWQKMHPEDRPYFSQYEMAFRPQDSDDWGQEDRAYSNRRASASHSLHDGDSGTLVSALSSTTMEECRSRAASDSSPHMLHPRQQMMFDQQQQHNSWSRES